MRKDIEVERYEIGAGNWEEIGKRVGARGPCS
jgi:hypothetical protein